jgi:hypothetical protein
MISIETRDYTGVTSEQIIAEMLKENTGSALCDSGGAYGRNWSSNAGRDFATDPKCTTRWDVIETAKASRVSISPTVSLYHWMVAHLEFDAELQQELDTFMAEDASFDLQAADNFAQHLFDAERLASEPYCVNTSNLVDDVHLSQVLQFHVITLEGDYEPSHLILTVHGGCDVRGGYTDPKCFRLRTEYDEAMGNARASYLGAGEEGWYIQDGCWRDIERSDQNATALKNPLDLPAYTPHSLMQRAGEEWDVPKALQDLKDMHEAIYRGDIHLNRLKAQAPRTQPEELLIEQLQAGRDEMKERAFDAVAELSEELAEDFIYVEAGRAWLVVDGSADELTADVSF